MHLLSTDGKMAFLQFVSAFCEVVSIPLRARGTGVMRCRRDIYEYNGAPPLTGQVVNGVIRALSIGAGI